MVSPRRALKFISLLIPEGSSSDLQGPFLFSSVSSHGSDLWSLPALVSQLSASSPPPGRASPQCRGLEILSRQWAGATLGLTWCCRDQVSFTPGSPLSWESLFNVFLLPLFLLRSTQEGKSVAVHPVWLETHGSWRLSTGWSSCSASSFLPILHFLGWHLFPGNLSWKSFRLCQVLLCDHWTSFLIVSIWVHNYFICLSLVQDFKLNKSQGICFIFRA